jgi:hypothetical protein
VALAAPGRVTQERQHAGQWRDVPIFVERQPVEVVERDVALQRLREDGERQVLLELGRATRERGQAASVTSRESLGDQGALPDPGFTPDDGDGALASANPVEQIVDRLKLAVAPDEPRLRGWVVELSNPANCKRGRTSSFSGAMSAVRTDVRGGTDAG